MPEKSKLPWVGIVVAFVVVALVAMVAFQMGCGRGRVQASHSSLTGETQ